MMLRLIATDRLSSTVINEQLKKGFRCQTKYLIKTAKRIVLNHVVVVVVVVVVVIIVYFSSSSSLSLSLLLSFAVNRYLFLYFRRRDKVNIMYKLL